MADSPRHDQTRDGYHCFQSISGLAPTYLSALFTRNSTREIVNLRNRETDLLAPRMKTSNGQKAFRSVDQRSGMS